ERRRARARLDHDDALLDGAEDARDVLNLEAGGEAILERLQEELLAREAVQVGVGMAEADEVERLLAVQLLIAGLEIDRRVAARAADGVEVAVVDVDVDAVHLVDEQLEAVEVDGDEVVDRDVRQVLDGVERPALAAGRPGAVDPIRGEGDIAAVAVDRDDQV